MNGLAGTGNMGGSDWSIRFFSLRGQEKVMKSVVLPHLSQTNSHKDYTACWAYRPGHFLLQQPHNGVCTIVCWLSWLSFLYMFGCRS